MREKLKKYFDFNVMYDVAIIEAYTRTFAEFRRYLAETEKSVLMVAIGRRGVRSFNFQGKFLTFHDPAAIRRIGRGLYRLVRNDRAWDRLRALLRSYHRDLMPQMTLEGMRRLLASLVTDDDFLVAYERMYRTYLDVATAYLFTDGQYHEYSIGEIEKALRQRGKKSIDVASLLRPTRPSIFQRANLEIARIGKLYRRKHPRWEFEFNSFLDRYLWLFVADTHYDLEDIVAGLKRRLNTKEGRDSAGVLALKRPNFSGKSGAALTVAARLAELGFQRMEFRPFWQWSDFMLHKIFEGFEKRHHLPKYFLAFLTHRETAGLMKRFSAARARKLMRLRNARMRSFATLLSGTSVRVFHDRGKITKLRRALGDEGSDGGALAGQVIYPGSARITGVARVIRWTQRIVQELAVVRPGEILIINQAKPDFLPFLKRVRALVADEGGITSHSAVICREFQIPSIIGTRVGTSAIRTGDTIELDFKSGAVGIIARAK